MAKMVFCISDPSKTGTEKDVKQKVSSEEKVKVTEIDASLERNVVDLLCNTLLNLPVSIDDIKDALNKVCCKLRTSSNSCSFFQLAFV